MFFHNTPDTIQQNDNITYNNNWVNTFNMLKQQYELAGRSAVVNW